MGPCGIAEAGRLHGPAPLQVPRSLLTTNVASASPSTSSAMIRQWLSQLYGPARGGENQVRHGVDFLLLERISRMWDLKPRIPERSGSVTK